VGNPVQGTDGSCVASIYEEESLKSVPCLDLLEDCRAKRIAGECSNNAIYMFEKCQETCGLCRVLKQTEEFGVRQVFDKKHNIKDLFQKTIEMVQYMRQYTRQFDSNENSCLNTDIECIQNEELCHEGDEVVKQYMMENCAPACQTCHLLEERVRCRDFWLPDGKPRVPSLAPGDLYTIFERISRAGTGKEVKPLWGEDTNDGMISPQAEIKQSRLLYKDAEDEEWYDFVKSLEPIVHSRPVIYEPFESLSEEAQEYPDFPPWIVTLENFLSDDEAKRFIELGYELGFKRSVFYSDEPDENGMHDDNQIDDFRSSENTWLKYHSDPVASNVMERISRVIGIPVNNTEDYQLLKYEVGQYYGYHHDYHEDLLKSPCGVRILTFFLYLDDVEEGGGTHFNDLNLTIVPKKGRAVIWPNVLNNFPEVMEEWTFHEAMPVTKGQKFGSNIWYHQYDFQNAVEVGC